MNSEVLGSLLLRDYLLPEYVPDGAISDDLFLSHQPMHHFLLSTPTYNISVIICVDLSCTLYKQGIRAVGALACRHSLTRFKL